MFQQPFTLRRIAAAGMPSFSQPRRRMSLFSFGATGHGAMARRSSIFANQGASASSVTVVRPWTARQCASVAAGVRKLEVQFTVVEPPTHRPCRMVIDLSFVWRPALSW
jgi:hypothetical protein